MIYRIREIKNTLLCMLFLLGIVSLCLSNYINSKLGYENTIIIMFVSLFTIISSSWLICYVNINNTPITSNNLSISNNLSEVSNTTTAIIIPEIKCKLIDQNVNIQEDVENRINDVEIPIATKIQISKETPISELSIV